MKLLLRQHPLVILIIHFKNKLKWTHWEDDGWCWWRGGGAHLTGMWWCIRQKRLGATGLVASQWSNNCVHDYKCLQMLWHAWFVVWGNNKYLRCALMTAARVIPVTAQGRINQHHHPAVTTCGDGDRHWQQLHGLTLRPLYQAALLQVANIVKHICNQMAPE